MSRPRTRTPPARLFTSILAFAGVCCGAACSHGWLSTRAPTAGFWYDRDAFTLPPAARARLGGPLTPDDVASIERVSRAEIAHAWSGLTITMTSSANAFWRVEVLPSLPARGPLPRAGESLALGFMGGTGAVGFDLVALEAVHFAPDGAPRQRVIDAIGRGIGRVAVHEFVHQMLGPAAGHNDADENSYEYGRPDRSSQYYGELHWTTAWPLLRQKFGR